MAGRRSPDQRPPVHDPLSGQGRGAAVTVREINKLTRDGGDGSNVYHNGHRVIRARTERGDTLVRHLDDGRWYVVCAGETLEVR